VARASDPETEALRDAVRAAMATTEARALALRRELDEIIESGSLTNTDDEHDPDGATIAYERARTAALLARACEDLDDLRRSLERIDAGDHGMCVACGRPIGLDRLLARPAAQRCIDCARVS
jgi:DnaK suppressor protein